MNLIGVLRASLAGEEIPKATLEKLVRQCFEEDPVLRRQVKQGDALAEVIVSLTYTIRTPLADAQRILKAMEDEPCPSNTSD